MEERKVSVLADRAEPLGGQGNSEPTEVTMQRRRATTADRPNEYLGRMYQLLDKDSGNWISRVVRQLQAFVRRGILVHYIFIFTLIGALPLIFFLATFGAHLTWILTLYFNRRFFAQSFYTRATPTVTTIKETL